MIDYDFDHIPVLDPMDRVADAVTFAAVRVATGSMLAPPDLEDCAAGLVVARPSPGDDVTREAFDAMDGYRRSNDSSDGGTP